MSCKPTKMVSVVNGDSIRSNAHQYRRYRYLDGKILVNAGLVNISTRLSAPEPLTAVPTSTKSDRNSSHVPIMTLAIGYGFGGIITFIVVHNGLTLLGLKCLKE